jgi:hypothetical protein
MFIPDPDFDFLPIPDPGSRGQEGPWIRNTVCVAAALATMGTPFVRKMLN